MKPVPVSRLLDRELYLDSRRSATTELRKDEAKIEANDDGRR